MTDAHHVAPEGAQRLSFADVMAFLDEHYEFVDIAAARARADRMDRIIERVDAAEHDPGTEAAWESGCSCPRQNPRAEWWDVSPGCRLHDPGGE